VIEMGRPKEAMELLNLGDMGIVAHRPLYLFVLSLICTVRAVMGGCPQMVKPGACNIHGLAHGFHFPVPTYPFYCHGVFWLGLHRSGFVVANKPYFDSHLHIDTSTVPSRT
jgi:hypothetical protein